MALNHRLWPSANATRGVDATSLSLRWLTALGETIVSSTSLPCVWSDSVFCQSDRRRLCLWHRMSSLVPAQQIVTSGLLCNCWLREGSQWGIWANNMIWFQLFFAAGLFSLLSAIWNQTCQYLVTLRWKTAHTAAAFIAHKCSTTSSERLFT